jgi:ankyrin repeat protein
MSEHPQLIELNYEESLGSFDRMASQNVHEEVVARHKSRSVAELAPECQMMVELQESPLLNRRSTSEQFLEMKCPSYCIDHQKSFLSESSAPELNDILAPDEHNFHQRLIACVTQGDTQTLKLMLAASSIDITQVADNKGRTLLHLAANFPTGLELLLDHVRQGQQAFLFSPPLLRHFDGRNHQAWLRKLSKEGFSALHYAAFHNNARSIDQLVGAGVDVHLQSRNGMNVLHVAA